MPGGSKRKVDNRMGLEETENNFEGTIRKGEGAQENKRNTGKNKVSAKDHDDGARESPIFSSQLSLR